ncbi:MAG: sortase B protein-sorting domain-containing protein [Oscillospiraceae bacterium]|nr:sortase B protein-sorting domain-containing protein [Oscillospiraceae bacterium]
MKRLAKFCTFLMVLVMVFGLCTTAYAAGTVTYDGDANKFIFAPGTKESPTSLFENFQNVMPGDTLTEQLLIKNDTSNKVKIKVYMRSLGAQENTDDFLSQMKLTVEQKDDSILFAAPADEMAQLTDWVYLGTVYSGGEITLDVTLEVPITMGNDYQNEIGYIDWEFKVEELPVEPTDPEPPKTGDTSNIFLYAGMMLVSLAALVVLLLANKRQKQTTQ